MCQPGARDLVLVSTFDLLLRPSSSSISSASVSPSSFSITAFTRRIITCSATSTNCEACAGSTRCRWAGKHLPSDSRPQEEVAGRAVAEVRSGVVMVPGVPHESVTSHTPMLFVHCSYVHSVHLSHRLFTAYPHVKSLSIQFGIPTSNQATHPPPN